MVRVVSRRKLMPGIARHFASTCYSLLLCILFSVPGSNVADLKAV